MKFPSYRGGATGSLIRGNAFDQSAPPYASTRRGDTTIKRNGDFLQVSKSSVDAFVPPALYMQMVSGPDGWGQLFGPWPEAEQYDQIVSDATFAAWQSVWNSPTHPLSFADGDSVHVGDGWVLERIPDNFIDLWFWECPCRTMLRKVDAQDSAPVQSLAVANNGRVSVLFDDVLKLYNSSAQPVNDSMPSLVPMGWRDEAHGYQFAIIGRSSDAADIDSSETGSLLKRLYRYAIYTGDTVNRRLVRSYMPDATGGRRWWSWYEALQYQNITRRRATADRTVCVVGRGHLLSLAVERYKLESGILEGVTNYAGRFGRMPVGTAPTLLRSRDFGATWTQEPATFLNAVNGTAVDTLTNSPDSNDPDTYTEYPSEVRQVFANPGDFHAAHMGNGRIALVAAGKSATPWPRAVDGDVYEPAQSLYFYASNTSGGGFTRKPWPIDQLWLSLPTQSMLRGGGWREVETPVWPLSSGTLSTFGPGSFFMVTQRFRVWTGNSDDTPVPREYGAYPETWSYRVHYTQDFGDTWAVIALPQDLFHMRITFPAYKAFQAAALEAAWGSLGQVQPPAPYRFCVLEPSAPGRGPLLMATASEYASYEPTIQRIVRSFVSDPQAGPFAGWREVDGHLGQYLDAHIGRLPPVPVYVGDDDLDEYPRKVRPGFTELDRP